MNAARQLVLDNDNGSDRIKFDFDFSYENDFKPTFTCRRCGKAEYRNGEFETIKLGDIFTHITHFPSGASPGDDNICTQCVDVNDNSQDVKSLTTSSSVDIKPVIQKTLQNNNNTSTNNYNNTSNHNSEIMVGHADNNTPQHHHQQQQNLHQQHHHAPPTTNLSDNSLQANNHHSNNNQINSTITVAVLPGPYGEAQKVGNNNLDGQYLSEQPKYTINVVNPMLDPTQSPADSLTTYVVSHLQEPQGNQQETSSISSSSSSSAVITNNNTTSSSSASTAASLHAAGISLTSNTTIVTAATTTNGTTVPDGGSSGATNIGQQNSTLSNGTPNSKECQICKKVFKSNKIAQLHFQRVHEKVGRYCCHVCGIRFSYRGSLDSHLASHTTPEITHNCPTCGQKFKEKSNLTNHMKIHSDNPKKFMCEFCPSGFSKRVNLRYHIKRKHPDQVANSTVLNNSATTNNNSNSSSSTQSVSVSQSSLSTSANSLNNGNNMNQSYQPNVNIGGGIGSSTAGATNKSPNSTKDKPQGNFKCEHCGRMFLFKNNLKAHLRTHTRDKKYTCEICEKSFIYKESLKNHMLLHSNELPYHCDICGKKFRDRSNRRKHVKNVHKYLFTNGDGTPSAGPATATMGNNNKTFKLPTVPDPSGLAQHHQHQPGDPNSINANNNNKKKRNNGKKNQSDPNDLEKRAGIIKSTNNSNSGNKKRGGNTDSPPPNLISGNKSVIVSMAGGMSSGGPLIGADPDRKIIMSPSPKNMGSPMEYNRLPVTVHVPASPAGSLHQHYVSTNNRNQNVIVKASSASPSSAADLELYHRNQNVIVYPKSKGTVNVITDYAQAQQSTVISQTNLSQQSHLAQQTQQQYYTTEDPSSYEQGAAVPPTYMTIPMATITSPGQESRPNSTIIYEFAPNQVQGIKVVDQENLGDQNSQTAIRYDDSEGSEQVQYSTAPMYATPAGADGSYHIHHPEQQSQQQQQQQQQQYWTLQAAAPTDANNQSSVPIPSDGSTPYTTASTISAPVVAYESPITAASNVLNAPSYGQADVSDPANSNYFYKDLSQFDFSYL